MKCLSPLLFSSRPLKVRHESLVFSVVSKKLREISFIYCQYNQSRLKRSKTRSPLLLCVHFISPAPFFNMLFQKCSCFFWCIGLGQQWFYLKVEVTLALAASNLWKLLAASHWSHPCSSLHEVQPEDLQLFSLSQESHELCSWEPEPPQKTVCCFCGKMLKE